MLDRASLQHASQLAMRPTSSSSVGQTIGEWRISELADGPLPLPLRRSLSSAHMHRATSSVTHMSAATGDQTSHRTPPSSQPSADASASWRQPDHDAVEGEFRNHHTNQKVFRIENRSRVCRHVNSTWFGNEKALNVKFEAKFENRVEIKVCLFVF